MLKEIKSKLRRFDHFNDKRTRAGTINFPDKDESDIEQLSKLAVTAQDARKGSKIPNTCIYNFEAFLTLVSSVVLLYLSQAYTPLHLCP